MDRSSWEESRRLLDVALPSRFSIASVSHVVTCNILDARIMVLDFQCFLYPTVFESFFPSALQFVLHGSRRTCNASQAGDLDPTIEHILSVARNLYNLIKTNILFVGPDISGSLLLKIARSSSLWVI
jgi:hypothetical protein